jgi:cbb3-type cytochrome oxidase cytochrome c subunit
VGTCRAGIPRASDRERRKIAAYVLKVADLLEEPEPAPAPIKQQGPDLIRVPHRLDFEWAKRWIRDPKAIDPKTKMVGPDLTPDQVDAVRMFVWKTAIEANAAPARGSP